MKIQEIRKMETCVGNTHESTLRGYQILQKVKEMILRQDSIDTILEVIEFCESKPE